MIKRPLGQRKPGTDRLELGNHQRGNVVGLARIAIIVLPARGLGDAREKLQRDIARLQPGQVLMAPVGSLQHIASPHQRIGMEIDDLQRLVQRLGLGADRDAGLAIDLVHAGFEIARRHAEETHCTQCQHRQRHPYPFAHCHPLVRSRQAGLRSRVTKANPGTRPSAGCCSRAASVHALRSKSGKCVSPSGSAWTSVHSIRSA